MWGFIWLVVVVAVVAVPYESFPDELASCNAPSVMRVCDAVGGPGLDGLFAQSCESLDECDLRRTRTLSFIESPQNESFVSTFSAALCRSRCRLDSDCQARFGERARCVADGDAEGYAFEGSFCVEPVENAAEAAAECNDGNPGTVDLAIELGAALQWGDDQIDITIGPDEPIGVLFSFTPCYQANSTTCVCAHLCTPLNEEGCAGQTTVGQLAYLSPLVTVSPQSGDFNFSAVGSGYLCPRDDDITIGFLCATPCEGSPFSATVECPDGIDPGCAYQTPFNASHFVANSTVSPPTFTALSCFECTDDSECDDGNALTLDRCVRAPPSQFPEVLASADPPDPPQVGGYCIHLCQTVAMNTALSAPQCVDGRAGFRCSSDEQCVGSLECSLSVCVPPAECTDDSDCALALNLISGGSTVSEASAFGAVCILSLGRCAMACESASNSSACPLYYDSLQTPAYQFACVRTSNANGQHICRLRCQSSHGGSSNSQAALIITFSVLAAFLILAGALITYAVLEEKLKEESKKTIPAQSPFSRKSLRAY